MKNMDRNKRKKIGTIALLLVIVMVIGAFAVTRGAANSNSQASSNSTKVLSGDTSNAKATATVGKTFTFKAINQNKVKKDIKFTVLSVERKDEIKVQKEIRKGNKQSDFLLVRIEIENPHSERLALAPADMIRLQDARGKFFSPDFHNGNVILDPLSVKKDLLSFVVSRDIKKFTFQVGELEGDKEKIEVNF